MKLTKETMIKALDTLYDNVLEGFPGEPSIEKLAEDYLKKSDSKEKAIDSLIKWQTAKGSLVGGLSSIGGIITLPISIPVSLSTSFYFQMRIIAGIATISDYDIRSDQVKTFVYCCLVGNIRNIKELMKGAGIKIGEKITHKMISSISGQTLTKINQLVGFRLFTKFGEKGIINLAKWIPIVSVFIGGSFDYFWCRSSGKIAKKVFFKNVHR